MRNVYEHVSALEQEKEVRELLTWAREKGAKKRLIQSTHWYTTPCKSTTIMDAVYKACQMKISKWATISSVRKRQRSVPVSVTKESSISLDSESNFSFWLNLDKMLIPREWQITSLYFDLIFLTFFYLRFTGNGLLLQCKGNTAVKTHFLFI